VLRAKGSASILLLEPLHTSNLSLLIYLLEMGFIFFVLGEARVSMKEELSSIDIPACFCI
jgi:hypothetical protein